MFLKHWDFSPHGDTLIAVVVGALLATLSGIVATQLESWLRRRERERDAVLLFGEVLSTLRILLNNADEARGRGEPYGPFTMRMLRTARREIDIYERNRERLYDLRTAGLRLRVHSLMVRLMMPLDGIIDAAADLAARPDDPSLEALREAREASFGFLMRTVLEIAPVLDDLGHVAHHSFAANAPDVSARRQQ